jgi:poly-gamma-glutamate synthesis protein (capsule biosynthesis protein)
MTPFQPVRWTSTPAPATATPTSTPSPFSIGAKPYLPEQFIARIKLPDPWGILPGKENSKLQLVVGQENLVSSWIYALVAPFPTIADNVPAESLQRAWLGEGLQIFNQSPLLLDESTLGVLTAYWGEPAPGAVKVLPASELLDSAWDGRPSWGIVPFEQLHPRWKVLSIDGISPIHKDFDSNDYALTIPFSMLGEAVLEGLSIPASNRDLNKMTVLAMTGVTALVRATAFTMERDGITYPAQDIGPVLRDADITHISNEVPFAEDCPFPNPVQPDMRFCSRDSYIALLEEVGTDIVELTGDHFSDWGADAMLHTLELYDQAGWLIYGGGANLQEARQALYVEHNGNHLAFIGCNAKGGGYARASSSTPGAAACDFNWMQAEIKRGRQEGYLPIVTFQHFEYYTYTAQPDQLRDARLMTSAGAIIVSGSQAHHPQGFEFSNGRLIHYGLGNLFFDQYSVSYGARQAFIDRHVFYNGEHISTELLTILFVDYARPRVMTTEERIDLLQAVFKASGW